MKQEGGTKEWDRNKGKDGTKGRDGTKGTGRRQNVQVSLTPDVVGKIEPFNFELSSCCFFLSESLSRMLLGNSRNTTGRLTFLLCFYRKLGG